MRTLETSGIKIEKNYHVLYRACNHLSLIEKSSDDVVNKAACCVKHVLQ